MTTTTVPSKPDGQTIPELPYRRAVRNLIENLTRVLDYDPDAPGAAAALRHVMQTSAAVRAGHPLIDPLLGIEAHQSHIQPEPAQHPPRFITVDELAARRRRRGGSAPAARRRAHPWSAPEVPRREELALADPRRRPRQIPRPAGQEGEPMRAKPERTRHPGIYKRAINGGRRTVYDVKIGNQWITPRGAFTRLDDALAERERLLVERRNGANLRAAQQSLARFVETDWRPRQQARVSQGKLRASTLANYERDLKNHVLPVLGDRRLREVGTAEVQRLADTLSASQLKSYTVINILNALSSVLELARRNRLIPYNPASSVDKPEAKPATKPTSLSLEQVEKLGEAGKTVDDRNLILVGAFAGLRISEALGLRWESVNLDPGVERLVVERQFYKGEEVDRPKTRSGHREVILCSRAAEALRSQLIESARPNPLGLVFPSPEGKHQRDSNWTRRVWKPMREAAKLPKVTFHDLRHFYVSHVSNAGLAPALSQQLVGHTDERTHRTYTHAIPGAEPIIREALERAFAGEDAGSA